MPLLGRFGKTTQDRRDAYAKLMERIEADPPVLPLWRPYESWAMRQNVTWTPQPGHIPYVLDFRAGAIAIGSTN